MLRTFRYGDYGDRESAGGAENSSAKSTAAEWPLWEIFIRSKAGLDVYTRRLEGVSIWVVESRHIHASSPDDSDAFYEPASDKVYRHPTFYDIPEEITHM
jgi:ring-1,2-phenylacetyl-CoA epoxidase subunit PaaB